MTRPSLDATAGYVEADSGQYHSQKKDSARTYKHFYTSFLST